MRVHVLCLPVRPGAEMTELHVLGWGVTQYVAGRDDPAGMVIDFVQCSSEEPLNDPQPVFYDVPLTTIRGGWRGYLADYEQDTLTTARTRREAFEGVKASALAAIEAREQVEMAALVDDLLDRVDQYDSDDGSVRVVDFSSSHDVEDFEG